MRQQSQVVIHDVLSMPCDLHAVRPTVTRAMDLLREAGCKEEDLLACEIALTEACNNAVQNAPPHLRSAPLPVTVYCDACTIKLSVADKSPAFQLPSVSALPAPEAESGRGLFLIRTLMDGVTYNPAGSHHVMEMTKTRRP